MAQKLLQAQGFSGGNIPGFGLDPNLMAIINENILQAGISRRISMPSGIQWRQKECPIDLAIQGGNPAGTITNPSSLIADGVFDAPLSRVFHVDPVDGNDANTGIGAYHDDFSAATAVKTLARAITLQNTAAAPGQIRVNGVTNPVLNRAAVGSTALTQPCSITSVYGKAILSFSDLHPGWAVDATYPKCYSVAESNCSSVFDLIRTRTLIGKSGRVLRDRYGEPRTIPVDYQFFATPAALNSAPDGTFGWTNDGAKTYVRRDDGLVVSDTTIRTLRGADATYSALPAPSGSNSLHLANFELEGGFRGTNGTRNFWLDRCNARFMAHRYAGNGFSFSGVTGTGLLTRCESHANGSDGFNPHATDREFQMMMQDCVGWDNGRGTAQSCNGLTSHEGIPVIDLSGDYQGNRGGNVRFVGNSRGLFLGTRSLDDFGDLINGGSYASTAFGFDNNAVGYLLGVEGQSDTFLRVASTAKVFKTNSVLEDGGVISNGLIANYRY